MRRALVWALAAAMALAFASAGVAETVTDMMGDEVALPESRERVISLSPAMTEVLFALGVGDRLVGVDSYSDYPPEAAGIPVAGDYSGPNAELILSLEASLVFASNKLQADAIAQLSSFGIPTLAMEPTSYEGIYDCIELAARVMGADPTELIAEMRAREAAATAGAEKAGGKRVYYALSFGEYGDWSAGPGTFVNDLIVLSGGVNVAQDAPYPWIMYTLEQIAADDPDVILVGAYGEPGAAIEELSRTPGYDGLRAVLEGNVFEVDGDAISRPGPRIVDALEAVAAILQAEG